MMARHLTGCRHPRLGDFDSAFCPLKDLASLDSLLSSAIYPALTMTRIAGHIGRSSWRIDGNQLTGLGQGRTLPRTDEMVVLGIYVSRILFIGIDQVDTAKSRLRDAEYIMYYV
jgi:hypothetical protein